MKKDTTTKNEELNGSTFNSGKRKGLEALETIRFCPLDKWQKSKCWKVIEKELNVLEIIKERKVDIYLLEITKNVDQYNRPFGDHLVSLCRLLTEEEYNLLKEVLL